MDFWLNSSLLGSHLLDFYQLGCDWMLLQIMIVVVIFVLVYALFFDHCFIFSCW